MKRKFLSHDVKEYLKLYNIAKFFYTFALQRFVNKIYQFEFFVLSAKYSFTSYNKNFCVIGTLNQISFHNNKYKPG